MQRIACAAAFLYHGSAVLFGAFDGPGPQNFSAFLHAPVIIGYLVGLAQVAGGLAILTGVLFRVDAACIMDWRDFPCSYFPRVLRWQRRLRMCVAQLLIAFSLLLTGPGAYWHSAAAPAQALLLLEARQQGCQCSGDRCRGLSARVLPGPCYLARGPVEKVENRAPRRKCFVDKVFDSL